MLLDADAAAVFGALRVMLVKAGDADVVVLADVGSVRRQEADVAESVVDEAAYVDGGILEQKSGKRRRRMSRGRDDSSGLETTAATLSERDREREADSE